MAISPYSHFKEDFMEKILFLCTGNSCRSQMAEGWGKKLMSSKYEFYSAGLETHGLNPKAVTVMQEEKVDISNHTSKNVGDFQDINFDFVFTVCGHADETCPAYLKKAKVIHVGFDDPPKLEQHEKSATLKHYRRVRDEIKNFVTNIDEYIR